MNFPAVIIIRDAWYGKTGKRGTSASGQVAHEYEHMDEPGARVWATEDRRVCDEEGKCLGKLPVRGHRM